MILKERISNTGIHAVLIAYSLLALFPLILILINSFKSRKAIFRDPTGLPLGDSFSGKGYASVLSNSDFPLYFGNSMVVTCVALVLILLLGAMADMLYRSTNFPAIRLSVST